MTSLNDARVALPAPVSPDDRLPTFVEVTGFDAASAWARLTPEQQTFVGVLAVRLAAVGNRLNFEHDFTTVELREVEDGESTALTEFYDKTEPLWADLYGWRAN
ncbi:hypothetical protein [Bradyrhizobium canariense]|uniref:hypothetical protein n=1 Tax=Bradyrhizobium canariense TaxID=255045 RepID=UPI000A195E32|nr:hypothetical protein [Bradyrhizobium canariense]